MAFDPQAQALNAQIKASNPAVLEMLSDKGRAIFFPALGILSQSAQAKGKAINATIGIALEEDNSPMALSGLMQQTTLSKKEQFPYAPSQGNPQLRTLWKEMMIQKNPELTPKVFSQPVVTCALTHGLSIAGYLFCDPEDTVILPDFYWENYDLVFAHQFGTRLQTYPTFDSDGRFHISGLEKALQNAGEKVLVSLNFPNNPTGYTLTEQEVPEVVAILSKAADAGKKVIVMLDDAYFGLVYEDGVYRESLFAQLCDRNPNLLAIKIDGPTKEDYVWGYRVGFLTYGIKNGDPQLYQALEAKTAGAIRGNISNVPAPSQSMLLKAYQEEVYHSEKSEKYELLKKRYQKVRSILNLHPEYSTRFTPLPFNSGYFMCVQPSKADPERVRQILLDEFDTGVIALQGVIRLAFSSTPTQHLDTLFQNLYAACGRAVENPV